MARHWLPLNRPNLSPRGGFCQIRPCYAAGGMTNMQLYFTAGLPTIAVLVGILMNAVMYTSLNARMTSLENRIANLEAKFDTRVDILTGKVIEIDNHLTRLEERFERWERR